METIERRSIQGDMSLPQQPKRKEEWRRYGAARRKELVAKDETEGGLTFEMHRRTKIEKYFLIAEKATTDFKEKCRKSKDIEAWEESYVMGHRLKAFLSKALPQHPNYRKNQVAKSRLKNQRNVQYIKETMKELATKIDEDRLNTFITMDFEPDYDDISTSSSEPEEYFDDNDSCFADFSSMGSVDGQEWQEFTGWSFSGVSNYSQHPKPFASSFVDSREVPPSAETDSSRSHDLASSSSNDDDEDSFGYDEQPSDEVLNVSDLPTDDEEVVEDPHAFVNFQDADDESLDGCELDGAPSEFFKKISDEVVHYESDSEAVDSWAQDGESPHSCASSGTALTFDPARIAFREIMNNVPRDRRQLLSRNNNQQNLARQVPQGSVPMMPPSNILMLRPAPAGIKSGASS